MWWAEQSVTPLVTLVLPPGKADGSAAGEPRFVRTLRLAFAQLGTAMQGLVDAAIYVGVFLLPLAPVAAAVWWWRTRRSGPSRAPSAGGAI